MTIFSTAYESKPIVFRLYFQDQSRLFLLDAFHKDKPIAIRQAIAKLRSKSTPALLTNATSGQLCLSPSQFLLVRDWLNRLCVQIDERKAVCAVDGIANRLQKVEVPSWFHFVFIQEGESLVCKLEEGVLLLDENGWFLCGEEMWHCELLPYESKLIQQKIEGTALVRFLRDTLPDWARRGIHFECPLSYSEQPCLKITLERIEQDTVSLSRHFDCAHVRPLSGAPGFVIAGSEVRLTLQDPLYRRLFFVKNACLLKGDDIPELALAVRGPWSHVVEGDTAKFNEMHPVYENPELLLLGYHADQNGVGHALARAAVFAGDQYVDAAFLSRSLDAEAAYVRLESGYIPVPLLKKLGLSKIGTLLDGISLEKPYKLKMEELLYRGSTRLDGPWRRMVVPDFSWNEACDKPLLQHLNFLAKWGFNGGLLGGAKNNAEQVVEFFLLLLKRAPDCRVLIVGKKVLIHSLAAVFAPLNPLILSGSEKVPSIPTPFSGVVIAAASALGSAESLATMPFDVVMMLEPEVIVKTNTSEVYQQLHRIKAQLRLAVYSDFMLQPKMQWVQQSLLGITSDMAAQYAILDPRKPLPKLPPPFQFSAEIPAGVRANLDGFASVEVSGGTSAKSVPIPPRVARLETTTGIPTLRTGFEFSEQRFIKTARELVNKVEQNAIFMPFMTYWPTYESLTDSQARWYFYWRNEVRQQRYPHTDSSYIYLYIYELLNLVGFDTPQTGYYLLMEVWKAYRSAFPKLNAYMGNWMTDYVLLHHLDEPLQTILSLCGDSLSGELLDMQLFRSFCAEPVEIDVSVLVLATDYDITRSKFYQSAHSLLVDAMLPKVLAIVDAYLKKQQGLRIVELFHPGQFVRTRYAFRSAVYADKAREIKVSVVPLSSHAPLRAFLAQVTRCTENKLREIVGFSGKLRGIELDAELQKLISLYLDRELSQKQRGSVAPKLTIDREKLARATLEAEHTQRLLTVETKPYEAGVANEPRNRAFGRETVNADDSHTNTPKIAALIGLLTPQEKRVLDTLKETDWETADEALQQKLPDLLLEQIVHTINEKALGELGSLLIVQEGSKKLIDDDYRDELCCIYTEPTLVYSHASWDASILDDRWQALFNNISPWQRDMLHVLACGGDKGELLKIAGKAGSMVELLLDGMNEASMEDIGDLLIEDGEILLEYRQPVQVIFDTKE